MLLALLLVLTNGDIRTVDEHAVTFLTGVVGKGSTAFIIYSDDSKPVPLTRYYLLDLSTGSGPMIEDQRITGELPLFHPNGFVISHYAFFSMPQNFLLNDKGEFQNILEFESIKEWPENITMQVIYSNPTHWVVNYERPTFDNPEPNEQFLGIIDPVNNTFEEVFVARKDPSHQPVWLPLGKNFLYLNKTTAEATLYDGKSFKPKKLLPGMDLIPSNGYKEALKTGRHVPTFLMYTPNAFYQIAMHKRVSFVRKINVMGETLKESVLIDEQGNITRSRDNLQLLWEHEGKRLYLHLEEKTFVLK